MMKKILFAAGIVVVLIMLAMCTKDADDLAGSKAITYVKTNTGGCNGQSFDELKSATDNADTLIFTVRDDTLNAFIGLNYICCAPFTSEVKISGDSIIMTISDTCSDPYHSCYCRCNCYYTWYFLFADFENKAYYCKVILIDPRESAPAIFKEGILDLSN
jgi:hypothetical protein